MGDYQASANAIYDPQASADRTSAGTALASTQSDIAAAKAELQPYYAKAFNSLTTGESKAQGTQQMTDNQAGLLDSGLHANQANAITNQYASDRANLGTEQANKVAGYDRQSANANSSYQSALSAILDKYNGQKAAYVTDQQNKESDRAFQKQLADSAATNAASLQASGNANALKIAGMYNQPQANPASDNMNKFIAGIHSAFDGYNAVKNQKGYTENNIQPKIQELAARLGIDPAQANQLMYGFRKSQFGQ